MSDELTAELRRVYEATYNGVPLDAHEPRHACALLAVARHSAERQRGMEATQAMNEALARAIYRSETIRDAIDAMQRAAPLVTEAKP